MTLTTARIAFEDERTALGMDYAEAVLIIRRTMAHPIEVTEVKAPANRYEIGYHRELADDAEADLTPQELSDNGIDLVVEVAFPAWKLASDLPYAAPCRTPRSRTRTWPTSVEWTSRRWNAGCRTGLASRTYGTSGPPQRH